MIKLLMLLFALATSATQPATAPVQTDPQLWNRMLEIDQRASKINSLTASFEQKKFTSLLKRPLVSTGSVRVSGSAMRWDTDKPEPTVMLITEQEVQLYYPNQKIVELYKIDQRLGSLAASPLPRLEMLKKRFTFAEISVADLDGNFDPAHHLALRLTPIDPALREHIEQVRVVVDVQRGYILLAEMLDADGDRTVISFSRISASEKEAPPLKLDLPKDVQVTRPLEALEPKQDEK